MAFLSLAAAGITLSHVASDAATSDEPVHIAAGVEMVREGTGLWNVEHPPLAKALAGVALSGVTLRPIESPRSSPSHGPLLVRFLWQNDTVGDRVLFRSRLPFVAFLACLGLAAWSEARRRFGPGAGLLAMALVALEPNLSAHAGVVHTDLLVTLFIVLSLGPLARIPDENERHAPWLLGFLWGLALLTKFSAPLLALATVPILAAEGKRLRFDFLARRFALATSVAIVVSLAGFALAYRHQSREDREWLAADRLELRGGSPAAARIAIGAGRILPPLGNLLTGAISVALQSRVGAGPNYFLGKVRQSGAPAYFPLALAAKVPLGLLLAALAGSLVRSGRRYALSLACGGAFYLAATAGTTYNIGVRHVLFAFPFLALAASAALAPGPAGTIPSSFMPRGRRLRLAARSPAVLLSCGGLLLLSIETASVHPFQMSFVNAPFGGLAGGHRLFADSNVDWGQDLVRLATEAPRWSRGAPLPAVVFGGDFPQRHFPELRALAPGDEDRLGAVVAIGEHVLGVGPELLASKGASRDADRLGRLRATLLARGKRVDAVGGSIGIWRIGP